MGKLRAVKDRVVESQGEYEFDLRGLGGPLLKKAYPLAMLSVSGADTQAVAEKARAEGYNVDDNGSDLLIWDSNPSDGGHKVTSTNLFIFVLGIIESITSKTYLYLFQFDGLRMQLENGIFGTNQGVENAARDLLSAQKTPTLGKLHLSTDALLHLTQAGFTFSSQNEQVSLSFSDVRDMKDEMRKEFNTQSQKRSRVA